MAEAPQSVRTVSSGAGSDDVVLPFRTERAGIMGRIVRLGPVVDAILSRHDYPAAVSELLGEALALTALLGSGLKPDSRLTLQTKGDGPMGFLVVNYEMPGQMRGYASFTRERWEALVGSGAAKDQGALLGRGHLAMTIDPGGDGASYQGIVALEGTPLAEAALTYFRQSEQLPTLLRLAVARQFTAGQHGKPCRWSWRAGGLLLQHALSERLATREGEEPDADDDRLAGEADEDWQRVRLLAETVEDHELIDPTLSSERLLYRLFHEEGVRVSRPRPIREYCRCSLERVTNLMQSFGKDEIAEMREADGSIVVTCEFCSTKYRLAANDLT
jgi:molecular chaperone Hsp33